MRGTVWSYTVSYDVYSNGRGLTSKGLLFHQDNARLHTAKKTLELIENFGWEVVPHPSYSPDLAPSGYHLFGLLKNHLRRTMFSGDEAVKEICRKWLKYLPRDFFAKRLCIDEKSVYQYTGIMLRNKSWMNILSHMQILLLENCLYLLNCPRTRDLIATLFFSLSSLPSVFTAQMIPVWIWLAGLDWIEKEATFLWAFILSVTFFQFWNGFMTQTPVCCVCLSAEVCLQIFKRHHCQLNLFSQFFEYFLFAIKGWIYYLQAFLEGGSAMESEQLDPFSACILELATEEDVLAPKKEWISMSSCRYLIDPRNLSNYKKKTFCIANWINW